MTAETIVELTGVGKKFGATIALADVSLTLRAGEVHCLAGENGAGKSTLIKILTGAVRRDVGTYRAGVTEMPRALTPTAARDAGIGVVYQELSLLPELSVAENLLMSALPATAGVLNRSAMHANARDWLTAVGLAELDPRLPVSQLRPATRQLVEIAKVLGQTRN